jgi:hypothetical protein
MLFKTTNETNHCRRIKIWTINGLEQIQMKRCKQWWSETLYRYVNRILVGWTITNFISIQPQ